MLICSLLVYHSLYSVVYFIVSQNSPGLQILKIITSTNYCRRKQGSTNHIISPQHTVMAGTPHHNQAIADVKCNRITLPRNFHEFYIEELKQQVHLQKKFSVRDSSIDNSILLLSMHRLSWVQSFSQGHSSMFI